MKLSSVIGSGFLAIVMTLPSAMAADGNRYMEQRLKQNMEQYKEQTKENKDMHMEKRKNRFEKHEEKRVRNKEMYQNRLKEKQDEGFRMNNGSGGKR
jgi:uncharacterized membrane protein YhiD involved in acid resistance